MNAFEIGYTGVVRKRATVTAAVYWNNTKNGIYFTPVRVYSAAAPPPGWPLPPAILTVLANLNPPVVLPSQFTYLNLGKVKDKGIELGVDAAANRYVNVFTNYSYQVDADRRGASAGTTIEDLNLPANNRFNAGFNFSYSAVPRQPHGQLHGHGVLAGRARRALRRVHRCRSRLVNGAFGVRWLDDRLVTSIKVNNLANQEVQQHIFGDIIKRQIIGEARLTF